MGWVAVSCPQCSAPLPRIAIWRSVKCPSCGALITRGETLVMRAEFHQALLRARASWAFSEGDILCGGQSYRLLELLGNGEMSQVYAARRVGGFPYLAIVKISSKSAAQASYAREAQVLRELQAAGSAGAGVYFSKLLPELVVEGVVVDSGHIRYALVLRQPYGCWGSMAALCDRFSQGIDPRHIVWIWRRMLSVLGYIHGLGWSHGDVRPEHALVQPEDHGVRLIGWMSAQKGASAKDQAADLVRSARVALVLLSGASGAGTIPASVPEGLAQLVTRASQDEAFCLEHRAEGLDALLRAEALAAFGPPAFVPLTI